MFKLKNNIIPFIALAIISFVLIVCWMAQWGFNPTDEGVILALARRIFLGQAPHKNFISIRPVGSGVLHIPELILGGNYTFYLSRVITALQMGFISLFSVLLVRKASDVKLTVPHQIVIFFIAFALGMHTFVLMAWTTIDALFCIIVGTYFSTYEHKIIKQLAYGVAGYAAICRQNFLPLPFILIILNKDYKSWGVWLFSFLPLIVYAEMVYFSSSWKYATQQLFTRTELIQVGILPYLKNVFLWVGFIFAFIVFKLIKNEKWLVIKQYFILLLPIILLFVIALKNSYKAIYFFEFGVVAAFTLIKIFDRNRVAWFLIFVLMIAWCTSISLGYNSPALAGGILWVALLCDITFNNRWLNYSLFFVGLISISLFFVARYSFIYRDKPIHQLHTDITAKGFKLIKTNTNTALAITELSMITQKLNANNYCIVTDFAAYWVRSENDNLLPLDWSINDELPNNQLFLDVLKRIKSSRQIKYIITQKYDTRYLADSLVPIKKGNLRYTIIDSVQQHYIKKWEGKFFNVFIKPTK